MDSFKWSECQAIVEAGLGDRVKHLYLNELRNNLTDDEFAALGNISSILDDILAQKPDMRHTITKIIELAKNGQIKARNQYR